MNIQLFATCALTTLFAFPVSAETFQFKDPGGRNTAAILLDAPF